MIQLCFLIIQHDMQNVNDRRSHSFRKLVNTVTFTISTRNDLTISEFCYIIDITYIKKSHVSLLPYNIKQH